MRVPRMRSTRAVVFQQAVTLANRLLRTLDRLEELLPSSSRGGMGVNEARDHLIRLRYDLLLSAKFEDIDINPRRGQ